MKQQQSMPRIPFLPRLVFIFIALIALYFISRYNYLLFHSVAEVFSIIVAVAVFFIVWNSKNKLANSFLLVVGISFVFVGIIDLLHTLAYKGMGVFPNADADLATQLWIGARYLQSFSILAGLLLIRKQIKVFWLTAVMFIITVLFLLSVFWWDIFPVCFIEGAGLTAFKIISEYVISVAIVVSIILLRHNSRLFEPNIRRILIAALVMIIVTEMAFTLYTDVIGILNVLGHFFKIIAFYLIYIALVESGINRPMEVLYRDLVDSRNLLQNEIEERSAAEMAFRRSLDALPYPVAINNRQGIFTYTNQSMLDIFGYADLEEMNRTSYHERYTPEYQAVVEQRKKAQSEGELAYERIEHDVISKTGEIRTVDMQINKIWWEGEEQFQVVYRDITGRKEAAESLRRTNLFLEGMQKLAKLGGWSYDMATGKNYWSDFMYELYSVSKDFDIDDINMITDYFPGKHKQILLDHFERSQREGIAFDCELEFIDAHGRHRWVRGTGEPVYQDGKIVKIEGNLQDITERKKWEEEQNRTAQLESIGTLAGGIAHDFNNILTGILGNIGLAKLDLDEGQIDEIKARLNDAETASFRARDLTRQLLTFSRGGTPVKSVLSIEELVRESAGFSTRGSPVHPVISAREPLWPVEADEGQLVQVINNIVINAIQAMPNGGEIRLEMENIPDVLAKDQNLPEHDYVKLSIADQGIGIPEENLNRVFEPYFTTKPKGSGLGLATCYSVIRNHEGHISIESVPGTGTTVTIYIPASKDKTPEKKEPLSGTPVTGSGRILIMDDEPVIRQLLLVGLTGAGYEVVETADGTEAVTRYIKAMEEHQRFDAVIMDLTVPGGMGGKETVVRLREIDPEVKAIVSSGYSNDSIMANPFEYGFSGVVTKPFVIKDVVSVLQDILS